MMGIEGQLPEDLGMACSELLLEEIARGGCIDSIHQPLAILLMAFSLEDVSKIQDRSTNDNECKSDNEDVL